MSELNVKTIVYINQIRHTLAVERADLLARQQRRSRGRW